MNIEKFFTANPYSMEKNIKQKVLVETIGQLTLKHQKQCQSYRRILNALPALSSSVVSIAEMPMLPVRLFKMHELCSVPQEQIIKILTSSGTTSQVVSRVFLDKETSMLQSKALVSIVKSFIGGKRLPMILIDHPGVIKAQDTLSARATGLLGLSIFGRDHFYLLDQFMNIRWQELTAFLEKYAGQQILLFGFTFMVWQYFYQACVQKKYRLNLANSILIHSGGWKKLKDIAVNNETFKQKLKKQLGIPTSYNFYGMVEQVGSVFMECAGGYLHTPDFADIIVRDAITLKPLPIGKSGLVQVLSVLPQSYPGHSLLTEDMGIIWGEDDCQCGRKGKYFTIQGRLPQAEIRGCSDTHAHDQGGANFGNITACATTSSN